MSKASLCQLGNESRPLSDPDAQRKEIVAAMKEVFESAGSSAAILADDASLGDPMHSSLATPEGPSQLSSSQSVGSASESSSNAVDSDHSLELSTNVASTTSSGSSTPQLRTTSASSDDDGSDDGLQYESGNEASSAITRSLSATPPPGHRRPCDAATAEVHPAKIAPVSETERLDTQPTSRASGPSPNMTTDSRGLPQRVPLDAGDAIFSMQKFAENAATSWLHYHDDVKTLIWAFGFMPGLVLLHYTFPQLSWYLMPFSLYFGLAAAVIAHNHNHCATFTTPIPNILFSNYISIFYGYPTFGWIPTHNLNHHRFLNRVGDATITWRHTNEHHAMVASTYFFVSTYYQSAPIQGYIARAKANRHRDLKYRNIMLQYLVFAVAHISLLLLAVYVRGTWSAGLRTYGMSLFIPAIFSMYSIMFINYIQHVHCDAWHPYNHSRNFVSDSLNFLLFNNGYHTIHHNNAGLHWSKLPMAHKQIEQHIDPRLLVESFWQFFFESYVLSLVDSRYGTKQIGNPPYEEIATQPGAPQYLPMFHNKSYLEIASLCFRFLLGQEPAEATSTRGKPIAVAPAAH